MSGSDKALVLRRSATAYVAWSALALAVALAIGATALAMVRPRGLPGIPDYDVSGSVFHVAMLIFVAVGALIMHRRPANPIGWLLVAQGLLNLLGDFGGAYSIYGRVGRAEPWPGATVGAWLYGWTWLTSIDLLWLALLLFPDGRPPSRRWRPVVILALSGLALTGLVAALNWPYRAHPALFSLDRPVVFGPAATAAQITIPVVFLTAGASAAAIIVRFRRSRDVERQQIKWLLLAAMAMAAGSFTFFVTGTSPEVEAPILAMVLALLGIGGIPVAIGIAILRYRLYDIDLLIHRSLVYGALTLTLAAVYFASVVGFEYALRAVTRADSQLAIVLATLVIAALFSPLRRQIQDVIDRRFYRRKYNAQQILSAFSARLRHEVDLSELSRQLVAVVDESMQPAHVSLWLRRDEQREG